MLLFPFLLLFYLIVPFICFLPSVVLSLCVFELPFLFAFRFSSLSSTFSTCHFFYSSSSLLSFVILVTPTPISLSFPSSLLFPPLCLSFSCFCYSSVFSSSSNSFTPTTPSLLPLPLFYPPPLSLFPSLFFPFPSQLSFPSPPPLLLLQPPLPPPTSPTSPPSSYLSPRSFPSPPSSPPLPPLPGLLSLLRLPCCACIDPLYQVCYRSM